MYFLSTFVFIGFMFGLFAFCVIHDWIVLRNEEYEALRRRLRRKKQHFILACKFHYHKAVDRSSLTGKRNFRHFYYLVTRKCHQCGCYGKARLEHQNCAYQKELSNYYWACPRCQNEIWDNYQERWDEYNAGRL